MNRASWGKKVTVESRERSGDELEAAIKSVSYIFSPQDSEVCSKIKEDTKVSVGIGDNGDQVVVVSEI